MRPFLFTLTVNLLASLAQAQTQPNPFAGTFSDGRVTVTLEPSGPGFVGRLELEGDSYPLTAQLAGETLSGSFRAGGGTFSFMATLNGSRLTLVSDGIAYALERSEGQGGVGATVPAPVTPAPTPETQTLEVAPNRSYSAGTRVRYGPLGVSFVIPTGWSGAIADATGFGLSAPGRQGWVLVLAQAGASLDEMAANLNGPQGFGGDLVAQPLGPARIEGDRVYQRYGAGGFVGQAISLHGAAGNGALLLALAPVAEAETYAALLEGIAASVQLEQPELQGALQQWTEGLAGRKLYLFSYSSSNVLGATEQSSFAREASWHLCPDGRYAYVEGTEGTIGPIDRITPGGAAALGRWKVIFVGSVPLLALQSDAGVWRGHPLGFDGRNVYLDGQQVSVSASEACG